jgi:hypothetical protein
MLSEAVRPGQPIPLSWGIYGTTIEAGETFTATVSLNNNPCYTSKAITALRDLENGTSGAGESNVTMPIPSQQLGQELYAIGDHTLTVSVAGNASNKGPYAASATLVVLGDGPTDGWWQWTEPTTAAAEKIPWPLPYTPLGNLFNLNKWSAVTVQCELLEADITDGTPAVSRGIQSVMADIGPNANPVQFNAITQNWTWVDSPTGRIGAQTSKTFQYVVNLTVKDAWGNGYPPGNTHPPATVIVSVADNKINDAWAALNANATAVAVAAAGAVTGIFTFGIGAGVGTAAAALLVGIGAQYLASAKDPPAPDFNYLTQVDVRPVLNSSSSGEREESKTLAFLNVVLRCLAIGEALSATEGKLIGARMRENARGMSVQSRRYTSLGKQLQATAQKLTPALTASTSELADAPVPSIDEIRATLRSWQVQGIPAQMQQQLAENSYSSAALASLEESIASISVDTVPPIQELLAALSVRTLLYTRHITDDMTSVLAG